MPLCVHCATPVQYLYTVYQSTRNVRLEQCVCAVSAVLVSQLAHHVMPVLTQYMGTLNGILQQTLQSQSPAVGLAAMKAATSFIQELDDASDRDKFQVCHCHSSKTSFLLRGICQGF